MPEMSIRPTTQLLIANLRVLDKLLQQYPETEESLREGDDMGSIRFQRMEQGVFADLWIFRREHIDDVKQAIIDLGGEIPEDLQDLTS